MFTDDFEGKRLSKSEMIQRRQMLKRALLGGGAALAGFVMSARNWGASAKEQEAQAAVERATRGMPAPRIRDVQVIDVPGFGTRGGGMVVKVLTDQDGLYGYGDATVGGRGALVRTAVEKYLKPLVVGRATDRIEEIWQLCYFASYYKNDQVQNAATAGVCDALWDIKGRQVGLPVYQLVGGKARDAAEVYAHSLADGVEPKLVVENSKKLVARGVRNIQVDVFSRDAEVKDIGGRRAVDRDLSITKMHKAFAAFRKELPANIKIGTDVHSLYDTVRALQFCKDCEAYKPWYWIEDVIVPEDQMYLRIIRQQTSVPLSLGELWNNPQEWRSLIEERLIDYVRNHVSHCGGFTPARRIAALAENYQVKTGWHGAPTTPIGGMINLTLDLTVPNFGIHEHFDYAEPVMEIFRGYKTMKDGYAWVSENPGWGIEIDEAAVAKLPQVDEGTGEKPRLPDGMPSAY